MTSLPMSAAKPVSGTKRRTFGKEQEAVHLQQKEWEKTEGELRKSHDMRHSAVRQSEMDKVMEIEDKQKKISKKKTKKIQKKIVKNRKEPQPWGVALEPVVDEAEKENRDPQANADEVLEDIQESGQQVLELEVSQQNQLDFRLPALGIVYVIAVGAIAYFVLNDEAASAFLEHYLIEFGLMRGLSWWEWLTGWVFEVTSWSERLEYPMLLGLAVLLTVLGPLGLIFKLNL